VGTQTTNSTKKATRVVGLCAAVILLTSCTNKAYQKAADKAAYGAIKQKTPLVKNMDEHFTIEQTNVLTLAECPKSTNVVEFLGREGDAELGAYILSLEKALEIAINHSRTYQTRKEQLYLSALSLTLARHQFTPIFSGGGTAQYTVTTIDVTDYVPDPNDPKSQIPVYGNKLSENHTISGGSALTADILLATGARLTTEFTTDFLQYMSGTSANTTASHLLGSVIQPLWRGAGYKVTMENLTQAERNLLYALRDFTRFRKDFSVQVATEYYRVLQDRDQARNSYSNFQSSRKNADRTRALAQEGRVAQADLGRLEQQELTSESGWINAVVNYKRALDNFKILIGLKTDAAVMLDDGELQRLKINHPEVNADEAIKVALVTRLDYQNALNEYEDAQRKIDVAANALRARVDLLASAGIDSKPSDHFAVPDINRYKWNVGLNLDLPLDRTAERNAYRSALINREQSKRSMTLLEDQIKLEVRDSWRALESAKRAFEISKLGVALAQRRVEEQNLLAELGRANAQNQVDAENDLAASKNQYTSALVGHTVARLQFWNNLGILYIKDAGQWEEPKHAKLN
jgi:outer membrane protein TolC